MFPVYNEYASPYHQDIFAAQDWTKYAIGYMWGTFGLLYAAEATPTIRRRYAPVGRCYGTKNITKRFPLKIQCVKLILSVLSSP